MNPKMLTLRESYEGFLELSNQLQTKNATIVEVVVAMPDRPGPLRTFTGTARRDPNDKPNDDIGYKLALGRALRSAARALLKEANAEVREQERQRQRHLQASQEASARREERRRELGFKNALSGVRLMEEGMRLAREETPDPWTTGDVYLLDGTLTPKEQRKREKENK